MLVLSCSTQEEKLFTKLGANETGIKFKNILKETEAFNVLEYGYLYNGGGVSVGDLNNDGLPDIYFTGNMVGSRLYINKGNFEFDEIAEKAGVFAEGLWNTGTTMADVNGDGLLDIYVCRSAAPSPKMRKNLLFINNGDLTFTESASKYGLANSGYSTQASFFDYDKDGDLDVYILNHSTQEYAGFGQITPSLKNKKNPAYSDKLYRNDNGKFKDVSSDAGLVSNILGFGLGLAISDINNDGWPDIYVSNDYNEQDYLYINNKNGSFTESLEKYIGHTSLFSMGSDIADINNDGYMDIITLDMLPEGNYRQKMVSGPDNYDKYQLLVNSGFYNQTMRNMLQLNNNGESFSEIGQFSGISNTDWSWASLFADLDNDGYKDVFITNGYKRDYTNMDFINFAVQEKLKENKTGKQTAIMELLEISPATIEENYTYHNNGDLTFSKVNSEWGLDKKSLSNGAAYADLDNDGDLDLIVNNIEEEAFIYRNNSEKLKEHNYLRIRLKGEGLNTFGIGSRISVTTKTQVLTQEVMPTRGYQSSVDNTVVFGLGKNDTIQELTITWPDFKEQNLQNIPSNQTIILRQIDAQKSTTIIETDTTRYFVDISIDSLIPFKHQENNFVDFKTEQLLLHKLSTQGPKMAKGDVNGDGLDDLFIAGAKGQTGQVLIQHKNGEFNIALTDLIDDTTSEDTNALFFDADNDKDLDLYVVSGGNEFEKNATELQDRLYQNNGKGKFTKLSNMLPDMKTSGSVVRASDFDNDGDLDLFVGGRLVPGEYPTAPKSYILQNDGKGRFTDITTSVNENLEHIGMITDALWSDFSGDGIDDLIVVGEFMAIRLFKNNDGKLTEIKNSTLNNTKGWWNTIKSGDFDNDGDTDYIVGNFGLNSQLKATEAEPVQLYVKDFDKNGSLDPILTSFIQGESYPVFSRDDLIGQLSYLKGKYINYSDYADQKISDIFTAEELKNTNILEANYFASSYIENLGENNFKITPLPASIQFAPIYGILINDFNQDGNLDVLMAGNFFGNRVKYGRYDANKGSLLLGDGKGNFRAIDQKKSGLNIDGEVKDIQAIINADKEPMIIFSRNNQIPKTYKLNF
ncbi:VCBS repeat-containing protein [uncultured Maribacter sp.]|uniref:VCBS repeat-containing protein n=1 Tax=uncultured Maribacter sp. TaxID=431308 RepID=UPI002605EE17|nr:VCBS repeat-containing protein [uncultured Maribacter sp.]